MIKVEIKTNGVLTNINTQCADQSAAEAWVNSVAPTGAFGQLDRWLEGTDGSHTDTRVNDLGVTEYFFLQTFTVTYTDNTAELLAISESNKALAYLASTDWYVTRFTETATAIPAGISDLRAAARLKVI